MVDGKVDTPVQDTVHVSEQPDGAFVLENNHLRATLLADGRLVSLIAKPANRECIASHKHGGNPVKAVGGNVFLLHEDKPLFWDAW